LPALPIELIKKIDHFNIISTLGLHYYEEDNSIISGQLKKIHCSQIKDYNQKGKSNIAITKY
jgi:hypothetical protein